MHLKQCEIVCDVDKLKVDIQETCMKYKTIKEWAYINHDKDDTRPHYHIYLNFGVSSVDTSVIATWFQVADNFVSRVKGRKADMLMYLTHGNDTQKISINIVLMKYMRISISKRKLKIQKLLEILKLILMLSN